MITVPCDHFLMHGAGAMNPDAQTARWNSLYIAQIALDDFHMVNLRKIKVYPSIR
jgi:hypothetical protein